MDGAAAGRTGGDVGQHPIEGGAIEQPALHHHGADGPRRRDVGQRIALQDQQVSHFAGGDRTVLIRRAAGTPGR